MITNLIFPPHNSYRNIWPNLNRMAVSHFATMVLYRDVLVERPMRDGNVIHLGGSTVNKERLYLVWSHTGKPGIGGFVMYDEPGEADWDALSLVNDYYRHALIADRTVKEPVYVGELAIPYMTENGAIGLRVNSVVHWEYNENVTSLLYGPDEDKITTKWISEEEYLSTIVRRDICARASALDPKVFLPG